jgi:hypothetical protein
LSAVVESIDASENLGRKTSLRGGKNQKKQVRFRLRQTLPLVRSGGEIMRVSAISKCSSMPVVRCGRQKLPRS